MMMPANFSAVAENEMSYVMGGASLVDYLAPVMTTQNWQNVSTNVVKIVGNSFINKYMDTAMATLFDGHYVPGDFTGGIINTVTHAYDLGSHTYANGAWDVALGVLNAGMSVVGGLAAIYTLGSSPIGLEVKKANSNDAIVGKTTGFYGTF